MFILEYKFKTTYSQFKDTPYWIVKKRFKQLERYQEEKAKELDKLKTKR